MHPSIPHLVEVQRVDDKIAELRAALEGFPKKIVELDATLNGARGAVTAAKEAQISNLKERKKLELDAEQWKERAKKYRDQTAAVKTNEAYRALQHEIANAEAEAAKVEDSVLERMVASEDLDRRLKNTETNLKEAEQSVTSQKKEVEVQYRDTKKKLEAALAEHEKVIAPVDEDLRELYARIAKRHNGTAMSRVRGEQCSHCGLRILPHIVQELHQEANEEVSRCESCGLILYSLEPVIPANRSANSASAPSSASSTNE